MTLWELAGESSRCWEPLTYMFVDETSGEVKYVGTTKNLRNRLIQHGHKSGKLELGAEGYQPKESGDLKDPSERTRRRKYKGVEEKLAKAGVRVHVAFDATEWHHWYGSICFRDGKWRSPEWNLATPPKHETYRGMRNGAVETYEPPTRYEEDCGNYLRTPYRCLRDRTVSALNLEKSKKRFDPASSVPMVHSDSLCWHDRLISSLRTDRWRTEYLSGEVTLERSAGEVTAQRSVGIGQGWKTGLMKNQKEEAEEKLNSGNIYGWWPSMRRGACERHVFFAYCRCVVPCGQRWALICEPSDRRVTRERCRVEKDGRWRDPWQRHGLMSSDDEAIADLVEEATTLDSEMKEKRARNGSVDGDWPRVNELTKLITALRERDYYGGERGSYGYRTLLDASRVTYLADRVVRRVCVDCEMSFATRRELSAHVCASCCRCDTQI